MRVLLVCGEFPPMRSSGAVQLRDLARQFVLEGHSLTCLVALAGPLSSVKSNNSEGYETIHIGIPNPKVNSRVRRVLAETLSPYVLKRAVKRDLSRFQGYDCVIWYSPSIFFGPLVAYLKRINNCNGYLIIRDIFPEWAADMGLMGRGLPYWFFKAIAHYQYSVANVIGVQTTGNRVYFERWSAKGRGRLQVLQNWLADTAPGNCSIVVDQTPLRGRKIFVYAGNMGVAQGMDHILAFVDAMQARTDVGFLFVGRGSDSQRLRDEALQRQLQNVLFYDEIDPDEIPGLYAQCHVGIVALDVRHKTHNIPGKFISYMQSGLPVMALINPGNDLEQMILSNQVGVVSTHPDIAGLVAKASDLLQQLEESDGYNSARCRALYLQLFSPKSAVTQIVEALTP
jgi:glycosyltransferase involved in cell wall biosynthesis